MLKVTALTKEEVELCPIRQVVSKVTGKWQLLIIFALEDGALRFSQVKRTIGDVTQRVLTENLRGLERDGYVSRRVEPGPPVEVHYELTEVGRALLPLLLALAEWAGDNHDSIRKSRDAYDSTT